MTIWNGLTSDGAVVPIQVDDQGRVIAVGSGPDSPLVLDGDYLRPRDATKGLGTANIDLDASGRATLPGQVICGSETSDYGVSGNNAADNSRLWQSAVSGRNFKVGGAVWAGLANDFTASNSKVTSSILENGSASFVGSVSTTSFFKSQRPYGSFYVFQGTGPTGETIRMNADGSATFAGPITLQANPNNQTEQIYISSSDEDVGGYYRQRVKAGLSSSVIVFRIQSGVSNDLFTVDGQGNTAFRNILLRDPDFSQDPVDVRDVLQKAVAALAAIKEAAADSNTDLAGLKAAILAALSNH